MPPRVAAVTMVYNEAALLPVWARHYAGQVGADYCYVLDHGSTERLSVLPGMNVVRLPRTPHDDQRRAELVSNFVAALLGYFDWVIYTDVDELVVADPDLYPSLQALCAASSAETITCVGLDVQHRPAMEADLDLTAPIGPQRAWSRFTSAMCKPLLTRVPRRWSPGFHSADAAMVFEALYLFHLHWADREVGLARLAKTRTMAWTNTAAGAHQKLSDAGWTATFDQMAILPERSEVDLTLRTEPLATWLGRTAASTEIGGDGSYNIRLDVNGSELWRIPERFRQRF